MVSATAGELDRSVGIVPVSVSDFEVHGLSPDQLQRLIDQWGINVMDPETILPQGAIHHREVVVQYIVASTIQVPARPPDADPRSG